VWENGGEVGKCRELDVGTDKRVKSGRRADVDASQDGDQAATDQSGIERVVHLTVDPTDKPRAGSCIVPSKSPKSPASSNIASDASHKGWEEGDNQQAQSTASGPGSLTIDLCQWKTKHTSQNIVQALNRVKHGNYVQESSNEANCHLGQNSLGDIPAGTTQQLANENR